MKYFKNILAVALISVIALPMMAQGDIISAKDFMQLIKTDKNVIVVDASKSDSYVKMHVKDAVNIPSESVSVEGGDIEGLLKSPAELAALFGKAGISNSSTVVVYDGGSQKYSSRIYWTLKYLGATNVKLLHKDMDEWKGARVPLTKMPSTVKEAAFSPKVNNSVIATIAEVKSGKYEILDVRAKDEFDGSADNSDGHLPNAINLDYKDLLTDTEAFKSKEEMAKVLSKHGITESTPIAAYCRTSVRATVTYAALLNVMGWNNVKVYDGAYLEWVKQGNNLETAAGVTTTKKASGGGGC